jgi:hypothetical protein
MPANKVAWSGTLTSVQPRIRLLRSFDQRSHSYLGYVLRVDGTIGGETREFLVAIGEAVHVEHQLKAGDRVGGEGVHVDSPAELAELYKVSKLQVHSGDVGSAAPSPPWPGVPPTLEIYRARGHRRLAARTYATTCTSCIWGCHMAVELIVDHWKPGKKRYRDETFCYGPISCPFYKAGPTRKVPGRRGMSWEEEDWIDDEEIRHRGPDD